VNKNKPENSMALNNTVKKVSILMLVFCFVLVLAITGCRKSSPPKETDSGTSPTATEEKASGNTPAISKSLNKIITNRSGWNPILTNSYGKTVPDFKVTDITGKTHSLSDYKGKDVLVVLWATWCQPCVLEIPHLIALRNIIGEDKLAILAISNEPAEVVAAMAKNKEINYTVVSYQGVLPTPLNRIRGYPSAFFIRPDGTLKLVVEGGAHLGEMKSIIFAE
jgi:thiol-disulfide isomerase/thioredoxin